MPLLHLYDAVGNSEDIQDRKELFVGDLLGLDDLSILSPGDRTKIYRLIKKQHGCCFRSLKTEQICRFRIKVLGVQTFFDNSGFCPFCRREAWLRVWFNNEYVCTGVFTYDLTKE